MISIKVLENSTNRIIQEYSNISNKKIAEEIKKEILNDFIYSSTNSYHTEMEEN